MPAEPQTITSLARALQSREVTVQGIVDASLARIADRGASLNAFITVFGDEAREAALAADREIAGGHYRGPMHGIPISIKDLFDLQGMATTAASRIRQHHRADTNAIAVARLLDAGAIVVGKTNLHEFALGTTNEDSAFGPVRHPLDTNRIPGGSSGGSAASVLAEMAYASLGSDTGGSIRIPAAFCGLVGLKPSFGDVPTTGSVPLSATLDHVGPLCRSVADARVLYEVLCARVDRPAEAGPYVLTNDSRPAEARPDALADVRIGVMRDYFTAILDPQVASAFDDACSRLRNAGAVLEDVVIPHAGDIAPVYLHIALSEAAAYHAKTLESRPDDYTPNVRMRLEMGRYILAEDYLRALRGREVLRHEVDSVLVGRRALLLPTVPVPATRLGATTVKAGSTEEPVRNITLRLTQLFNITGHPAITLPCGKTKEGLPIGVQIVGRAGQTHDLLDTAELLEPYLGPGMSR
jgi:aspartyl-tRNA(Asn)/glutamyl-tRNA(Gln) amidotransferase subunit A